MKRMAVLCATLLFAASAMLAGERLDLKAVAGGDFGGEALTPAW